MNFDTRQLSVSLSTLIGGDDGTCPLETRPIECPLETRPFGVAGVDTPRATRFVNADFEAAALT
ncbi:MAG: hypothetical protein AAGF23_11190 [Acidobacteriota bacterium]